MSKNLVFLKLGGSLITDKTHAHTPRLEVLKRLAQEIAQARAQSGDLQLLLGHGSGSFGHVPARKYNTRQGVRRPEEWNGFAEVWYQAAELNHLVLQALEGERIPALAFPPSAMVIAKDGKVAVWNLDPLRCALANGLLPVVYGDVVFDTIRGGTILSTEDLFAYLTPKLHPGRILLAGLEPGVWADYPARTRLLPEITPSNFSQVAAGLGSSAAIDVTGGMDNKVRQALALVEEIRGLKVLLFSGEVPGTVRQVLLGEDKGTLIHRHTRTESSAGEKRL
jgi:isopentenyl phosphate kinase